MYRYLAFIWNVAAEHAQRRALTHAARLEALQPQWSRVLDEPGVVVLHAGCEAGGSGAQLLYDGAGVILGRIFTRRLEDPVAAGRVRFDGPASARVVATRGRVLFEEFWGRYVAVVCDRHAREVCVLRDPSGAFPCWHTSDCGVSILCSDLHDCAGLELPPFTVNWRYIAALVARANLQVPQTGLNEVTEVQPGERLAWQAGVARGSLEWRPLEIAARDPLESADAALELLRATTVGCVHAWAACHTAIVHNLSGGLDSSIVLSCLRSAATRPRITCLNYFAPGPGEDERGYARLMARHADVDLVERELLPANVPVAALLQLRPSPRPWFYLYELEHGADENQLAAARGASGLFSGAGGDSVFYQARAELAVRDYRLAHGYGRGLLRTAVAAARVSRQSVWPLLWASIRHRLSRGPDPAARAKPLAGSIVSEALIDSLRDDPDLVHPWLRGREARHAAPGKLWHVQSLSVPPAYYSSFQRSAAPERTLPLLSQPLVELCLRIPTYVLISGGYDRALARRAFAAELPGEIARRVAKGRADRHCRDIVDAHLPFLRELLLDGLLVRRGFLDRAVLEVYLDRRASPADFQYNQILQEHACTEAWLRTRLDAGVSGRPGR